LLLTAAQGSFVLRSLVTKNLFGDHNKSKEEVDNLKDALSSFTLRIDICQIDYLTKGTLIMLNYVPMKN
jgi:hypothetical protein